MESNLYRQEFDLEFCNMKLLHNGILLNKFQDGVHIEVNHIKEMLSVGKEIYKLIKSKYSACAILPEGLTISKEAREFSSTWEANQYMNASAIVISSLPHRIIGNFMVKVQHTEVPLRLFENKEEAFIWLANH